MTRRRTAALAAGIAIAGVVAAAAAFAAGLSGTAVTTATSRTTFTTTTCSGYPPIGNCFATYGWTFMLRVNYSGPWELAYQGYNSMGEDVTGSYNGTGIYSKPITVSGSDNGGLTLCAQAKKLDSSNSILTLTITGHNETSLPYGSVSYCGGVVP